jgi:hypothetical protein
MNELIDLRDRLQRMADAACDFTSETADGREWDRRHLAALMEAWMILDREVTRLNEVSK